MSQQPISLSPDLKKLRDEGYDIEIRQGYLLIKDVPYVNSMKEVKRGILVSEMSLKGHIANAPGDHVVSFAGEIPCDASGLSLNKIIIESVQRILGEELTVQHKFSSKPFQTGRYKDYYEKMTAYANILISYALAIDSSATAQTFPVVVTDENESVFKYIDTASSRAEINAANAKLALTKVAIVGLGGTGSYVLDLVAKTPVKEIHLFDRDDFLTHNAFRAPGAASIDELSSKGKKVVYLKEMYSKMRRNIIIHDYNIEASNLTELKEMNFVFVCIDTGASKKLIVEALESFGILFIDTGMGIEQVDGSLRGIVRVTTSTPVKRDHFRSRVPLTDIDLNDNYKTNIQVADLNALNAVMAVIKWKKLFGFYLDFEQEHDSTYSIDCNMLTSDDRNEEIK